ncbi:esterase/lipase family protein [Novipirellula aureliae]|nr:hypothetical protein [Novipirellula aureliae]
MNPVKNPTKQTVILVPGFCEPRPLLWPLRLTLRSPAVVNGHCTRKVRIFKDRIVFRDLENSASKLRQQIESLLKEPNHSVAIVTHSFGDWVARQAISRVLQDFEGRDAPAISLASIAPIMTASPIARGLHWLGGDVISEVAVMSNASRASTNVTFDVAIPRLIVWANVDVWIRTMELEGNALLEIQHIWASHLSIVLHPRVHRSVKKFINGVIA